MEEIDKDEIRGLSPRLVGKTIKKAHNASDALDKIAGLQSSASEIDGSVYSRIKGTRKVFKNSTSLNTFGRTVNILGDSLTKGVGATDSLGYAQKLREVLNVELNGGDYGLTAGIISYSGGINENDNALEALTGFYSNIPNGQEVISTSNPTLQLNYENKKIKVVCLPSDSGKTVTVESFFPNLTIEKSEQLTIDSDGISNEFISGETAPNIRVINDSGSTIQFECLFIYNNDNDYSVNMFANSGRKLAGIEDVVLNKWFNNSEYAIFALGTNDDDISAFNNRIDYIISIYNAQNYTKLIILDLDINKSPSDEFRQAIFRLHSSCIGSIYLPYQEFITSNNTTANRVFLDIPLNALNQDLVHFSDSGHELLCNLVLDAMGVKYTYGSINKIKQIEERITADELELNNTFTSGNLISSTWDSTLTRTEGSGTVIGISNNNITIDTGNNDAVMFDGVQLNGTFIYDFTGVTDSLKNLFQLKAGAVTFTAPVNPERVRIETPLTFMGKVTPIKDNFYENRVWAHFSRDVDIKLYWPFMSWGYPAGTFSIDNIVYTPNEILSITEGWHEFKAFNYVSRSIPTYLTTSIANTPIFRADIVDNVGDLKIVLALPSIEVGGEIKELVSRV